MLGGGGAGGPGSCWSWVPTVCTYPSVEAFTRGLDVAFLCILRFFVIFVKVASGALAAQLLGFLWEFRWVLPGTYSGSTKTVKKH